MSTKVTQVRQTPPQIASTTVPGFCFSSPTLGTRIVMATLNSLCLFLSSGGYLSEKSLAPRSLIRIRKAGTQKRIWHHPTSLFSRPLMPSPTCPMWLRCVRGWGFVDRRYFFLAGGRRTGDRSDRASAGPDQTRCEIAEKESQ